MKFTNQLFKPVWLIIIFCFIPISIFAQNITVKGIVKDASGEPIIGASIVQKGTTNGNITDIDGIFSLNVPSNSIMTVSFVGYKKLDVQVTWTDRIAIALKVVS